MPYLPAEALTDRERLECFRAGFIQKLAESNVTVGQFDSMLKRAAGGIFSSLPSVADMFKTAIIFGVPIGGLMHVIMKSSGMSVETRKLRNELEYYRDMMGEIRARRSPLRNGSEVDAPAAAGGGKENPPPRDDREKDEESGVEGSEPPAAQPKAPSDRPKYVDFSEAY